MARLKDQPQRFSFDAAVRVLTFLRRRADPAAAARFTSPPGHPICLRKSPRFRSTPGSPNRS